MIRIRSKQEGFRRCGVSHPIGPTDYDDDRFTEDELADLQSEPQLIVESLEVKSVTPGPSHEEIVKAILGLDPDNSDLWTGNGLPTVPAIVEALGETISAKERDVAWASTKKDAA